MPDHRVLELPLKDVRPDHSGNEGKKGSTPCHALKLVASSRGKTNVMTVFVDEIRGLGRQTSRNGRCKHKREEAKLRRALIYNIMMWEPGVIE